MIYGARRAAFALAAHRAPHRFKGLDALGFRTALDANRAITEGAVGV